MEKNISMADVIWLLISYLGKSVSALAVKQYDNVWFKFIYGLWDFKPVFLEQYITRTFLAK